jgi:hypothetical protein
MLVKQALDTLVIGESNESYLDVDALCRILDLEEIGYSAELEERLKGYYVTSWLCTDTRVGAAFWFLDGFRDPVLYSCKLYRKQKTSFLFNSNESYEKLRNVIKDILDKDRSPVISIFTLDTEIPDLKHSPEYKLAKVRYS